VWSGSQWWVTAGGAFDVMASKEIGADMNDPDKIAKRTSEYKDRFLSSFIAARTRLYRRRHHAALDAEADRPGAAEGQKGRDSCEEARQFAIVTPSSWS
jgi:hypothetical protein